MKTLEKTKTELNGLLVDYACNSIGTSGICEFLNTDKFNEVSDVLGQFQREWDGAECDSEGATSEQEAYMDSILESYVNKLCLI